MRFLLTAIAAASLLGQATGNYDFDLEWSPDQSSPDKPSIFAAVREQLGLRIDSERAPVEVIVIERLEKPTED
jgi:uncharacterized protein (TIGR03435 family)